MSFVSLPCRTTAEVDLKTPLKKFIQSNYDAETVQSVNAPLEKLHDMRKMTILKLRDKSVAAADQVAMYHDTLLSLEPRVPMSETEARIDFKWTDITGKQRKVCTSAFERANLIFCYGAIHSQVAETAFTRDLKQSVISLKLATAAFDYLAANSHMLGTSLNDNSVDVFTAYSSVMQAQAQECLFLKAEQESRSPSLVAKLAAKSREVFDEALKRCVTSSVKPHIPKDWASNISAKMQTYAALTHYYQSKVNEESRAGGERVARLTTAYEILKSIRSNTFFSRQTMLEQIKKEREAAMKENEIIYHEPIPSSKELAPVAPEGSIGKMDLPIPLAKGETRDLFSTLVPLAFQESKKQAEVMHRSLISAETHRMREATSSLNAVMVSLNLPAAVQIEAQGGGSHDLLLEKAEAVRQAGGCSALREKVYSLPSFAERNREILNQQSSILDKETARLPAVRPNEEWRRNIQKMLDFLVQTESTDKMLAERFDTQASLFEILSKPKMELLAALNSDGTTQAGSPTGSEHARQALAQVCSQIETLKADRNSLTDQLDALTLSDATVNELLAMHNSKGKITEHEILDILNRELEGPRACVRASEKKQEELLAELQSKYEACFGRGSSNDSSSLSTRLNAAVDDFMRLVKDVEEGVQFYAQLTSRCLKMQDEIDDFYRSQNIDLTKNLDHVTISDTPAPASTATKDPPARPPPSYANAASFPPSVPPTTSTLSTPAFGAAGGLPAPAQPGGPLPGFAQPGIGWQPQPNPYGHPANPPYPVYGFPAYPPPAGMPMYGYYPGFPYSIPPNQMPPMPAMPGQPTPYGYGQPPTQQPR